MLVKIYTRACWNKNQQSIKFHSSTEKRCHYNTAGNTVACMGVCSHWWSWSLRHWMSRCPETGCLSLGCLSVRPPPPRRRCRCGRRFPPHSRSGCWRWSWHLGCGREGSLQRMERKRWGVWHFHCSYLLTVSLCQSHHPVNHAYPC